MVGWHHRLSGHESEQTPGDLIEERSLVCCSPWGRKESDTAGQPTLHGHRGMYPGFLLPLKKYIYIYFLFGCTGSQLHHVGSGSLTMDQTQAHCIGSRVLATGPPGKSLALLWFYFSTFKTLTPSSL